MKPVNNKPKFRVYKTELGYSFYDSSASSMDAVLRGTSLIRYAYSGITQRFLIV